MMKRRTRAAALLGIAVLLMTSCEPSPWEHELAGIDATGSAAGITDVIISPDGSHVAFVTRDDDLGPTDTNGRPDVYLRNLATGVTTLVSVKSDGDDSRYWGSRSPQFSADGTRIAFRSFGEGGDGYPDDRDNSRVENIYVRDLTTGETVRASRNGHELADDADPRGYITSFQISEDGEQVFSTVVFSGPTPDLTRLIIWDSYNISSGAIVGGEYNAMDLTGTSRAHASPDGRHVFYKSSASECTDSFEDRTRSYCVEDLDTGEVAHIDYPMGGLAGGYTPTFSDESSAVAYINEEGSIVVHDLATSVTEVITPDLLDGHSSFSIPGLDSEGILIGANERSQSSPGIGDGGIYHYSFGTGATQLLWSEPMLDSVSNLSRFEPVSVELNGSTVLLVTEIDNLGPTDTNDLADIYTYDLETGAVTLVSANVNRDDSGNGPSRSPSMSDDGRQVAFVSDADDLGPDPGGQHATGSSSYVATLHTADIGVEATASPEPVSSGGRLTYEVDVTNNGPDAAEDLRVGVLLPENGVDFADVATANGDCEPPAPPESRLVTCSFGDFEPGSATTVTVEVDVTASSGSSLESLVMVTAGTHDPDQADNLITVSSSVT